MSYSLADTRRRLPWLALALLPAAGLAWALPHHHLLTNLHTAIWWPLCWPAAHLLCGLSYTLTARSVSRGAALVRSSLGVYRKFGAPAHLAAALCVAIIEEIIFRYAMLHETIRFGIPPAAALALTSLVFAVAHLRLGLRWSRAAHYLDYFLFALVLGGATLASGSLWPAVLLHTGRNYILRCLLVSKEEYNAINRRGG